MPWLLNSFRMDEMLNGYSELIGKPLETWWRDEGKLAEYWELMGWPLTEDKSKMFGIPCADGHMAWLTLFQSADGERIWTLIAFSPAIGKQVVDYVDVTEPRDPSGRGRARKFMAPFVTQWGIKQTLNLPVVVAEPGKPCACRTFPTPDNRYGGGKLGLIGDVDDRGRIETVVVERDGEFLPANLFSRRWFMLQNRDLAFWARWERGQTDFRAYIAMLGCLSREQEKLEKRSAQPDAKHAVDKARAGKSSVPAATGRSKPSTGPSEAENPFPIGPGEWRAVAIGNAAALMEVWRHNPHCEICTVNWGVYDPAHPKAPSKRGA